MCKKIAEVNSLNPNDILDKYWDGKIPVDMKTILRNLSIRFRSYDISTLEKQLRLNKNDAILGLAFSNGNDLGILYSNRIEKNASNYILAHELAHCSLHIKPSEKFHVELKISKDMYSGTYLPSFFSGYTDSWKEIQADRYAADLLIPTKALKKFVSNPSNCNIENIADHFQVSREIVRLKFLNLGRNKVGEK